MMMLVLLMSRHMQILVVMVMATMVRIDVGTDGSWQ